MKNWMLLKTKSKPFNWFNGAFIDNKWISGMKIQKVELLTEDQFKQESKEIKKQQSF
ncbi:MAG: hypothetical protein Ta2D_04420 [Rickettsiales bacterium]|nr:MAG: hypothetical protein Ta2D_04420 [Rickettsiales bacterium]